MSNPKDFNDLFAERLIEARKARELSQSELARKAGLVPSAIGHFEGKRRKPSFANVRALAKALDVSADFLLGRTPSLQGATTAFRNEEQLSDDDRALIQNLIDLKVQGKKKKNE